MNTPTRTSYWTSVPLIAGVVALVAAPLLAAPSGAQEADAPDEKEMTAEIVDVDVQTGTLTLKVMDREAGEIDQSDEYAAEKSGEAMTGKELTLVVNEDTRITEDGGHIVALADLKPGERVNVVYEMDGDDMRVLGVDKSSGPETSTEMQTQTQTQQARRQQDQRQHTEQPQPQTQTQTQTAEPATTPQSSDDDAQFFAGVVLEVDEAAGLVRVEEASLDAEKLTVVVDANTELTKKEKSIDLTSIAIGDPVSIDYEVAPGGEKVARSIEVLTVPPTVE